MATNSLGVETWIALGSVLFPPRCACRERVAFNSTTPHGLCPPCFELLEPATELPSLPAGLDALYAPYAYGGVLASVVSAAKFDRRLLSARTLGKLLAAAPEARTFGVGRGPMVPIPLAPGRGFERGFNQSNVIARICSRHWRRPWERHLLRRTRETRPQSDLPKIQRAGNVYRAFRATRQAPESVVLVDDITTTGATLQDAGRALREAGARHVAALTVCRSE